MVLAPLTLVLLTAGVPTATPVVRTPVLLRDAVIDAAHRAAPLAQRREAHKRGELYRLSPKAGRRTAFVIIGAAAGFMGSLFGGFAASPECGPPVWLLTSATVGGGTIGWMLAGR